MERALADVVKRQATDHHGVSAGQSGGSTGRHDQIAQGLGRCGSHQGCGLLQVVQRPGPDQSTFVDHDEVVGEVLDLVEEVARHEHGASVGGVGAEQGAQRQDPLGVQAVAWLVEYEHRRVTELLDATGSDAVLLGRPDSIA